MTEDRKNQDENQNQDQDQEQNQGLAPGKSHQHEQTLADELGIEDIYDPMVGMDGKVFCTAGRDAPIAEFNGDFLILHPPQLPLDDSNRAEDFTLRVDDRNILLDEFGQPKKIPAAHFKGCPIYYSGEQVPGSSTHYAVALAHDGSLHALYFNQGRRLTTKDIYEFRNKSEAGELSTFEEVVCDI
ncbi:MAG: hypothetical protein JSS83_24815 [Cyanobacteria bacterium SZAS LIN-3]|nr:hypothetical protein [Cyanobacteria bacterium SZAS LIN-3]